MAPSRTCEGLPCIERNAGGRGLRPVRPAAAGAWSSWFGGPGGGLDDPGVVDIELSQLARQAAGLAVGDRPRVDLGDRSRAGSGARHDRLSRPEGLPDAKRRLPEPVTPLPPQP